MDGNFKYIKIYNFCSPVFSLSTEKKWFFKAKIKCTFCDCFCILKLTLKFLHLIMADLFATVLHVIKTYCLNTEFGNFLYFKMYT
jgi:hypothetical protein